MIYLLSQMILIVAVAVVLGMALGWLIHRARYSQKTHQLTQTIAALHNRLAQAKSDVSMLSDDYDEMHRQTQDQIIALREENRQIPSLSSNLEKSQLLVRQMMQRHETKVRELSNDNQKLSAKLAAFDEQAQTRNQVAAGLDEQRRLNTPTDAVSANQKRSDDDSAAASESTVTPKAAPDNVVSTKTNDAGVLQQGKEKLGGKPALFAASESDADPFDQVIEVADELQRELDITGAQKSSADDSNAVSEANTSASKPLDSGLSALGTGLDAMARNPLTTAADRQSDFNLKSIEIDADKSDEPDVTLGELDDLSQSTDDADDLDNLIALDDVGELTDPFDSEDNDSDNNDTFNQTSNIDDLMRREDIREQRCNTDTEITADHHRSEAKAHSPTANNTEQDNDQSALQLDGSADDAMLFEPVSQHDDLQQIFGIGPLTEKALNELGITSYSQLAELKQQEIQHIADALEIGPGRIERDNWVGNARRQLEDVLEQL